MKSCSDRYARRRHRLTFKMVVTKIHWTVLSLTYTSQKSNDDI